MSENSFPRFVDDQSLNDWQLALDVEHALRGLGIASSGKGTANVRSAVAALSGRARHLQAPSLAAELNEVLTEEEPGDVGASRRIIAAVPGDSGQFARR